LGGVWMIKIVGSYLNPDQRKQFNRSWEKVKGKKKTDSSQPVFQDILSKVGIKHSAK
jgi:hypothetical protein